MAGGDTYGGATPPISNFFGDKPTPPIMGMMGIDADAVGNHSFDRGQTYYRTQLLPLADFPVLSANVVYPDGKYPKEWQPSTMFKFPGGVDSGSSASRPSRRRSRVPGQPRPVPGPPGDPGGQRRGGGAAKQADAVVALGHEGANAGTVTDPTGPLIDIADGVQGVDVVIGDHNDLQVDALRPNGVLVTENRAKGVRFTRVRMVVGPGKDGVVYKTADYHKPWNIGVTPDPAIQAKIDQLNAQLAPILNVQIGIVDEGDPARRPVRQHGRTDVRVAGRQRGHGRDAHDVQLDRRAVRDHELGRPPRRPDVPVGRPLGRLLPVVLAAAVPDHARPVAHRAPVREHRRDDDA